jgi:chromate transporter
VGRAIGITQQAGWLHGLMIAAVAVVTQAVWSMARSLAPDRPRAASALAAAIHVTAGRTAGHGVTTTVPFMEG